MPLRSSLKAMSEKLSWCLIEVPILVWISPLSLSIHIYTHNHTPYSHPLTCTGYPFKLTTWHPHSSIHTSTPMLIILYSNNLHSITHPVMLIHLHTYLPKTNTSINIQSTQLHQRGSIQQPRSKTYTNHINQTCIQSHQWLLTFTYNISSTNVQTQTHHPHKLTNTKRKPPTLTYNLL